MYSRKHDYLQRPYGIHGDMGMGEGTRKVGGAVSVLHVSHISELLQGTFRDCQGGCEGHCGACQLEGDTESQASSNSSEWDKTDSVTGEPSQTGRSRGQVLG